MQTRSSVYFYFEKLFNMNTFYLREDILLIFYLNEMWDCIIKDIAQSKKTKKNRVVIKQSSDNVFLLFKRNVFCGRSENALSGYSMLRFSRRCKNQRVKSSKKSSRIRLLICPVTLCCWTFANCMNRERLTLFLFRFLETDIRG